MYIDGNLIFSCQGPEGATGEPGPQGETGPQVQTFCFFSLNSFSLKFSNSKFIYCRAIVEDRVLKVPVEAKGNL